MIISPNKHTLLRLLKAIQNNNYLSVCNKIEYCASEVDIMIYEKQAKKDYKDEQLLLLLLKQSEEVEIL